MTDFTASGGNFGAQTRIGCAPGIDYLISANGSAAAHTLTLTPRGGTATITRALLANGSTVVRGDGISGVTLNATDANVFWESGPVGSFRNSTVDSSAGTSGVVLLNPSATQTITGQDLILQTAKLQFGSGNNGQISTSGAWTTYGTIITGGNGMPAILGDSPTPATFPGPTANYAPVGTNLSTSDATHPTPPTTTFVGAAGGATYPMAGFTPQGFAGVMWFEIQQMIDVTANTLAGIMTFSISTVSEAGAAFTIQMPLTRENGTIAASIGAGATGRFFGNVSAIPLLANTGGANNTSTAILQANLIAAAGAGAFSATASSFVRRIG